MNDIGTKIPGDYMLMWTILTEVAEAKKDTELLKILKRLENRYGAKWFVPVGTEILGAKRR